VYKRQQHGVMLRSEMLPNDRNRMMFATYRFAGFKQIDTVAGKMVLMESDPDTVPSPPPYVEFGYDFPFVLDLSSARSATLQS